MQLEFVTSFTRDHEVSRVRYEEIPGHLITGPKLGAIIDDAINSWHRFRQPLHDAAEKKDFDPKAMDDHPADLRRVLAATLGADSGNAPLNCCWTSQFEHAITWIMAFLEGLDNCKLVRIFPLTFLS